MMRRSSESDEEFHERKLKWKRSQRNKPKKYRCCVPNCPTIDTIDNFLKFPSANTLLQQWLDAIPKFEDVITRNTRLCRRHFPEHKLQNADHCCSNGCLRMDQVVPSIFDRIDKPVNWYPRYMFELSERDVKSPKWDCSSDDEKVFILNIGAIWDYYVKGMEGSFCQWNVISNEKFILFYILQIDAILKIKCSVKINTELKVEVTLSGRQMDPADLTWILPITCQITRWNQLTQLLSVLEGSSKC